MKVAGERTKKRVICHVEYWAQLIAALVLFTGGHLRAGTQTFGGERSATGFDHFVTRKGNKLYDGEKIFRFVGANMPGINLPYDFTLGLPERMGLPTPWELEDAMETLDQMNLRVLRTWNLPIRGPQETPKPWHYVLEPGRFNEEAFIVIDNLLALANRHRIRVIFNLTAEYGDFLGGIGTYAAYRGRKRAEFYTDPEVRKDYKTTVRYVLERRNTVTGIRYRDDKAILAWQFGNEMNSAPDEWLADLAAYVKQLAPNQLVAETRHMPGKAMYIDPNIDLVTRHLYPDYKGVGSDWSGVIRRELATIKEQRPLFIGEFGPYIYGQYLTTGNVVDHVRRFLAFVQEEDGIAGALLWSMYFHRHAGGFYWHQIMTYPAVWSYHWPGFQSAEAQREIGLMKAIREAAFKMQNLAVPPPPAPKPPELLPFGDVPMFSWRGSAGAAGYDIERAAHADGPWTILAANVSDADTAYRPLFSDVTARAGPGWFYRVIARNATGVSKPSNVVGPVVVKRVAFVDELQDFSRAFAKSSGLETTNAYNALYAEYLFRAKGGAGEWIVYSMSSDIETIKLVSFITDVGPPLTLKVSSDGKVFTELKVQCTTQLLASPPGGAAQGQKRTMVEYLASSPPGQRFLKIFWNASTELDRVEIYCIPPG